VVLAAARWAGVLVVGAPRRHGGSPSGSLVGQVLVHGGRGQRLAGSVGGLGDGPPGVRIAGQPPGLRTGLDLDDVANGQRPVTE
jgi:hypothetical protein